MTSSACGASSTRVARRSATPSMNMAPSSSTRASGLSGIGGTPTTTTPWSASAVGARWLAH
eukprot:3570110-Pyramimonas_sp.AAC.1